MTPSFGFAGQSSDWDAGSGLNRVTLNSNTITLRTNNIARDLMKEDESLAAQGYPIRTTLTYMIVLMKYEGDKIQS